MPDRSRNWPQYMHFKSKVKSAIQNAKSSWATRLIGSRKGIWSLVDKFKTCQDYDLVKLQENIGPHLNIADELNGVFRSIFSLADKAKWDEIRKWSYSVPDNPPHSMFTVDQVKTLLLQLKTNKAGGSDGINAKVLKLAADYIAEPLTNIYNASIYSHSFPNSWKVGLVVPIPKCSNPKLNDFRPITLLPIVAKIFEKLVLKMIYNQLISHYDCSQFGFRAGESTSSALIKLLDTVTKHLDVNGNRVALLSIDLSKAFDKVSYTTLLGKLIGMGLSEWFIKWTMSYLENRTQKVRIGSFISNSVSVTSGVPQGGVLGSSSF